MSTARKKKQDEPTIVKKYANRRLYDTGRSSYVTLEDLCIMVKEGHDFIVIDAKTEEDLTRSVLTQIIVDQEAKGEHLLPVSFLRQLIGFYGDKMEPLLPNYLEHSLETFVENQEKFQAQMAKSFEGMMNNPMGALEEIGKQNMKMFETAMQAWTTPFASMSGAGKGPAPTAEERVAELKKNIKQMQQEIDRLSK